MPADVFVVTLIDETELEAEDVYRADKGQIWPGRRYPLPGSFADYLLRGGESLRVDDYNMLAQDKFKFEIFGSPEDTQSGLAVLLRRRDRVLGLMSVESYALSTYTDDDLELLELLAAHAAIALENTRLYQQAQTLAAVEERNRLARDLHDSVTQSLYSLTLLAEGWRRLAQRGRLADLDSALAELGEIAQQSLKEMRLLIYELRPPALEQEGLLGALHQRLGAVERRAGIEARLIAEELIDLPSQVEQGIYRITQEALNNALKHARATSITVFVRTNGKRIEVEVIDNGCGFEPEKLNGQPGLGLISMRERAEQMGGEIEIESKLGEGTTVKVRVRGSQNHEPD
jgi:signal transduction histidine kinase